MHSIDKFKRGEISIIELVRRVVRQPKTQEKRLRFLDPEEPEESSEQRRKSDSSTEQDDQPQGRLEFQHLGQVQ